MTLPVIVATGKPIRPIVRRLGVIAVLLTALAVDTNAQATKPDFRVDDAVSDYVEGVKRATRDKRYALLEEMKAAFLNAEYVNLTSKTSNIHQFFLNFETDDHRGMDLSILPTQLQLKILDFNGTVNGIREPKRQLVLDALKGIRNEHVDAGNLHKAQEIEAIRKEILTYDTLNQQRILQSAALAKPNLNKAGKLDLRANDAVTEFTQSIRMETNAHRQQLYGELRAAFLEAEKVNLASKANAVHQYMLKFENNAHRGEDISVLPSQLQTKILEYNKAVKDIRIPKQDQLVEYLKTLRDEYVKAGDDQHAVALETLRTTIKEEGNQLPEAVIVVKRDGPESKRPDPKAKKTAVLDNNGWTVLFRCVNPEIWNTNTNNGPDEFAIPLSKVDDNMRYLRLATISDGVIVPLRKKDLQSKVDLGDGRYGWNGTNEVRKKSNARQLGIYDNNMQFVRGTKNANRGEIFIDSPGTSTGHRGWGFGVIMITNDGQGFSWNGGRIKPTVFEISVKSDELTVKEQSYLLK